MATGTKAELAAQLRKSNSTLERERSKRRRLDAQLKETREQQAATADILKVISGSPADTQPVFDAIVRSALHLFDGHGVAVVRLDGDVLQAAAAGGDLFSFEAARKRFPMPLTRESASGRSILDRCVVHVADTEAAGAPEYARANGRALGYRAMAAAPMMREGKATGAVAVMRKESGAFSDRKLHLLQTFADQAVIAIENVRLFNETKEALERQRATAEVLASISGSMTDTQPVFDAIVRNLRRLFGTRFAVLQLLHDGIVEMSALDGDPGFEKLRERYPRPLDETTVGGRAMLSKQAFQLVPVLDNPEAPVAARQFARDFGFNSVIFSPMIHEGTVIGAIGAAHPEARPFDDRQIALIKTFADQAVIAIQNARLFNETKEALEHQTATAEVLQVISGSIANAAPVFDKILASCRSLFGDSIVTLGLVDEHDIVHLHQEAQWFAHAEDRVRKATEALQALHPRPSRGSIYGYVAYKRRTIHFPDVQHGPGVPEGLRKTVEVVGRNYAALYVPLLWEGRGIGALCVSRFPPMPFSEKEIQLLKTFADQAVIAIQNARLFNETKEALERQTATAEILKVIASSPSDVQPVLEAIAESAARLFETWNAAVLMHEEGLLHLRAVRGPELENLAKVKNMFPIPYDPENVLSARAIAAGRFIEIPDTEHPDVPLLPRNMARAGGYRAVVFMPLLREGQGIGTIVLNKLTPGSGLTEHQVALLRTFADQAVIAIENVRLFKELQARTEALTKSVSQLTALGEVGQAISSTLDLDKVLPTIVARAVQLTGLDGGAIYEYEEASELFRMRAGENVRQEILELDRSEPIRIGEGAIGRAAATRRPVQVPDIAASGSRQTRGRDVLLAVGARALLAVPLLREGHILGALAVIRNSSGEFPPEVIALLETFATQSAIAIQNARLFREIADKGRQLEEASRHKSQFLASMSHELRTPLNAILGFNEMILAEIYGAVPADMKEPLEDIQSSGKHLLRLINNVLDLAKIESGRMELALADYSVHDTVESVRSTLRPLAAEKGLEFVVAVPDDLPLAHGDSGRITQCLVNLAGNSLKFTKSGRVEIAVVHGDGLLKFSVSDTGIGIPAGKIGSLFTEFKQTDATIASEYGGTGLGLSITRKFIEMHGGRIWVESELGRGSSFIFEIPLRAKEKAALQ